MLWSHQCGLGYAGGDYQPRMSPIKVDFRPHAELIRQVDPRLDRAPRPRQHRPIVVGLVVVEVGTGSMQIPVNAVPGPMDEELAKPFSLNDLTGSLVAEVAEDRLPRSLAGLHRRDGGIAGLPHSSIESAEDLLKAADTAMYKAKQSGGNCCFVFDDTFQKTW